MSEILGPQNIRGLALPTGANGAYIAQWQMREGKTFEEMANELAASLGSLNQDIVNMWGPLVYITDMEMFEYTQGGSVSDAMQITDIDTPDRVHGETIGHGMPLDAYGVGVGGSWMYWRDTRQTKIDADIDTVVNQHKWRIERKVLTRFFTTTENTIATGVIDVPFVNGGAGSVDYIPPAFDGQAFTSAHDHYMAFDSDSEGFDDMLNDMAENLQEHGHGEPYRAIVARADVSSYRVLTDFVELVGNNIVVIDRGGATTGNEFFSRATRTGGYFGSFQSDWGEIELFATARIPTGYAGLYKSYGANNPRNSIAIRVHPDVGFGVYIEPRWSGSDKWPIQSLNVLSEFGVSCGRDRTNGVAGYRASGAAAYTAPTIS